MELSEVDSEEENNGSTVKIEEIYEFEEDEDPFKEVSAHHQNTNKYLLALSHVRTYLICYLV